MKVVRIISYFILLQIVVVISSCESRKSKTEAALNTVELLRGEITLCGNGEQQFGAVTFANSCDPNAQATFELAISLLHSFEYDEAEKAFVKVLDTDPDCAMAYWGVAMSNFHELWLQTGTGYLEKGSKILNMAASLPKSEREKDYLDAIGAFYHSWETVDHPTRVHLFEQAMENVYKKYSDDHEAAIFYALALTATADPADKSYRNQKKSGEILTSLFSGQPNHPGIAHYIIHNYDYPELAALALSTARRYADIAPASAHAQHMPSHIFTRLGLWQESVHSNLKSTAAALCYGESIDPDGHWDEELHGMDYLVYAYLQVGDNQKALDQYEYLKTFRKVFPANFKVAYTAAAIPSRIALENRNWKEAASLQLPPLEVEWKNFPWQQAILHFARALGLVHTGDLASAEKELEIMQGFHQALVDTKNEYMANQVQIQIHTIQAWLYYARHNEDEAIALMKKAALMEYNTSKHPVTPGEVLPAEELLGDLFLALNKPAEALAAYESNLNLHPNRFNGLYGAALAAKSMGNHEKAQHYFQLLLDVTEGTNSKRTELAEARNIMAHLGS